MKKTESEILFERYCAQNHWECVYLDTQYPNIKKPDYLVKTEKGLEFYAEIKEISNTREADKISGRHPLSTGRNKTFSMSRRRLFGWMEDDIRNSLIKIDEFSKSKFYQPLPFVALAINVKQAFIDSDIKEYGWVFSSNFKNKELLSAFGFLKIFKEGVHKSEYFYLDLSYNPNPKYSFSEEDKNYLEISKKNMLLNTGCCC